MAHGLLPGVSGRDCELTPGPFSLAQWVLPMRRDAADMLLAAAQAKGRQAVRMEPSPGDYPGNPAEPAWLDVPKKFTARLLALFTKVGVVCYGGGALSIPFLRSELVDKGVLSKKAFADGLALSTAVPGQILTNIAVFAGIRSSGALAAVAAIIGAVIPTSLIMVAATLSFLRFRDVPAVNSALLAIQPVTIGLVVMMIIRLAPTSLTSSGQVGIAVAAAAAILGLNIHPGILLVGVAFASLLVSGLRPAAGGRAAAEQPGTVYLAVKRLPMLSGEPARCHAFVAIDSASCWVSMGAERNYSTRAVIKFVECLVTHAPFKVTTVIIGKQVAFESTGARGLQFQDKQGKHGLADACRDLGIDLRVAGPEVPTPHLRIEQFNLRLKHVLKRLHQETFAAAKQSLQRYAWLHNECLPQKTAMAATPLEILQRWKAIRPQLFRPGAGRLTTVAGFRR